MLESQYENKLARWFRDFVSVKLPTKDRTCWRQKDSQPLCGGQACLKQVVMSIPIVLILALEGFHERYYNMEIRWDVPEQLYPSTVDLGKSHGLVYDIVGCAYFTAKTKHYTARFTPDGKHVYAYDGVDSGGSSILEAGSKVKADLAGELRSLPDSAEPRPISLVYKLRGGASAQRTFFERRVEAMQHLHTGINVSDASGPGASAATTTTSMYLPSLSMFSPPYARLADSQRTWMARTGSSTRALFIDYEDGRTVSEESGTFCSSQLASTPFLIAPPMNSITRKGNAQA